MRGCETGLASPFLAVSLGAGTVVCWSARDNFESAAPPSIAGNEEMSSGKFELVLTMENGACTVMVRSSAL